MKNKSRFNEKLKRCTAFLLAFFMVLSLIPTTPVQAATTLFNEATLKVLKSSKEYNLTPAGVNKKGVIYRMELDGTTGFCMDAGQHAKSGNKYARRDDLKPNETYRRLISYALYEDVVARTLGTTIGQWSDSNYALAQALVWGYSEGCTSYETALLIDIVLSDVSAGWRESKEKNLERLGYEEFIDLIGKTWVNNALNFTKKAINTLYIYDCGISGYQRILSTETGDAQIIKYDDVTSSKSYTAKESVKLSIIKTDKDTKKPLSNVSFDLYKDNVKVTTVTTDTNGAASYTFTAESTKTATSTKEYCSNYNQLSIPNQKRVNADYYSKADAQAAADAEALAKAKAEAEKMFSTKHTYKAVETKTKEAYYLEPSTTTQSTSYASGGGSGTITFNFTNTRQLGTIDVTKKDAETNYLVDGAVYGLYARENIVHPDGKTGVVYTKDSLVATFPKTGTNGKATLNNLYLGKYYVKEITAPAGYILSKETYNVDLTYDGQNVSVTDSSATVTDKVQRGGAGILAHDSHYSNGK